MQQSYIDELNIPAAYWCSSGDEDAVLLSTDQWGRELESRGTLPEWFPTHTSLSAEEVQSAVRERRPPDSSWVLVNLWCIEKPEDRPAYLPEPSTDGSGVEVTYSELLRRVARDNFCESWHRMAEKYPEVYPEEAAVPEPASGGSLTVLRQLLHRTFGKWPAPVAADVEQNGSQHQREKSPGKSLEGSASLQTALAVLELRKAFVVISVHPEFTLRHVASFSSSLLTDNSRKAAFVGYQMLRAIQQLHARGVCAGDFRLEDVAVNDTLWVQLRPRLAGSLCEAPTVEDASTPAVDSKPGCRDADVDSLSSLTQAWSSRRMSNMSYLLELNRLAGRRFDDPAYHPVVPWVTDLTQHGGGWRDLTRSKYRLNKGDEQLDMQYRAGATAADQVAHHISDVLSEITYYVYMARRTPRSVLCKHVRAQWVPGEYPTSLVRLYAWTPDECVPQFYTDPTVFQSIHEDMSDLELPEWASSPASFIARHRAALESDQVSSQLHHWIDLTFGYKLTGEAAVRAKNVTRHLAESGDTLRRTGVLQLFSAYHPPRQMALMYFSSVPPAEDDLAAPRKERVPREGSTASAGEHEPSPESSESSDCDLRTFVQVSTKDESVIQLPRNYQPVAALHRVEALGSFCAAVRGRLASGGRKVAPSAARLVQVRQERDVAAWLCVLAELGAPAAFRGLSPGAPLGVRLRAARRALWNPRLPACLTGLRVLLDRLRVANSTEDEDATPLEAGRDSASGLPPPTVSSLLQPPLCPLPLPPRVQGVYEALAEYRCLQQAHHEAVEKSGEDGDEATVAAELWVRQFAHRLSPLLPHLTDETLLLLVPHVVHLLTARATGVLAAWHVLSGVAERLGPARAQEVFLPPLLRLFQRHMITYKSMKLFHRSFLLHVAVRLGHSAFAAHFIPPLIEAVGGDRDPPAAAAPPTPLLRRALDHQQGDSSSIAEGGDSEPGEYP